MTQLKIGNLEDNWYAYQTTHWDYLWTRKVRGGKLTIWCRDKVNWVSGFEPRKGGKTITYESRKNLDDADGIKYRADTLARFNNNHKGGK